MFNLEMFTKYFDKESLALRWYILKRNPLSIVGFLLVVSLILLAILAPILAPFGPEEMNFKIKFSPPTINHLMGTNQYGMDIFSRVIYAARTDLIISLSGVALAVVIGAAIGALSGYFGGILDMLVMRAIDSQQAFPSFIVAMLVATVMGGNLFNLILVIAFVDYPIFARLVRGEMLSAKENMYAEAAESVGNHPLRIIFRHLLPNCMSPVYVTGSLLVGGAIMLTASLSFIGLGVKPPTAEWGLMVAQGSEYIISGRWWMSLFPGGMVWLSMFACNLFGDGLQDILDPRRR